MPRDSDNDCRIYIGNLPPDIRTKDVEDLFYKFGDISFVDLKTRRGPPFAFVEFKDPRDAKEAVVSRDGYDYDGYKLRVEFPRGRERGPGGIFKGYREREGYSSSRKNGGGGPPTRRSNYRVKITGLPPTGSWQDLKDHMREAGEVCYADVFKDGSGVVEFLRRDDMRYAIKKLDDSRFRSHEGEVSYVRVAEDTGRGSFSSRSRSRSPKRSRASPTYSPAHDSRSPSRSRSRSSRDDADSDRDSRDSRSISRSRSRSPVRRHRTQSRSKSKSRSISRSRSRSRSVSRSYSRSRSSSR